MVDAETGQRLYYSQGALFPCATQDTAAVIALAKSCISKIYREKEAYKKCGVILLDLVQQEGIAADLFQEKPNPKVSQLMEVYDTINARFGKSAVFFAAMGTKQGWKGHSDKCSQHYTSCWSELALAKA